MIKLFCGKSDSAHERKIKAAKLYMFECWVGDELVLIPEEAGDKGLQQNNKLYRELGFIDKLLRDWGHS